MTTAVDAHTLTKQAEKCLNRRCLPARKQMQTLFWDWKGMLMVKFMQ
jgi:hypothetical protein